MKKKHFVLDVVSFAIIIFNILSVICFWLPPGKAYYMPDFIMMITMFLLMYSVFGLGISGIVGVVLNIISIILKMKKRLSMKNNIVYIVLFVLTVPLAWLMFNTAMSV